MEHFIYGTQYYRAPTPLPEEWEHDIANMHNIGIEAFQIRVQWRTNEPAEDRYCFDDVDKLFEIAKKNNQKVIIKFMLENAPQYIFDRYAGARKDFHSLPILPSTHGAFYVGGWLPCFENPDVRLRATKFIEQCVGRYKDKKELILWNVWNEPRSRPAQDCACEHSMNEFRQWLAKEFITIEDFNRFFGVNEESFATIPVPGGPHGYWDFYLFRKWRSGVAIQERLQWVYQTIKNMDNKRPIMSHVGFSACLQKSFHDNSDDYLVAGAVDFYGTSYPVPNHLETKEDELQCTLLPDFMRCVDKNYFIHEFYPDWGNWRAPISLADFRYKLWSMVSRATKGIVYWQYRAERVGNEENLAGLVRMDGTHKNITEESAKFGKIIEAYPEVFASLTTPKADVAILFDYNSNLMAQIEDCTSTLFEFEVKENPLQYYYKAHAGYYKLFFDLSLPIDYIDTRNTKSINDYKVIAIPYASMIEDEIIADLETFVQNGGILLIDEGIALRGKNTWIKLKSPGIGWENIASASWIERKRVEAMPVQAEEFTFTGAPFQTEYLAQNGDCVGRFADGCPGITKFQLGEGRVFLFGFSAGYSYQTFGDVALKGWVEKQIPYDKLTKNPCDDIEKSIYSRFVMADGCKILIVFNRSNKEQTILLPHGGRPNLMTKEADVAICENKLRMGAGEVACIKYDT